MDDQQLEDVTALFRAVPQFENLSRETVAHLYSSFSEESSAASWLTLTDVVIRRFCGWLTISPLDRARIK